MAVIKRIKGDNYPLEIELQDSNGDAIDITGATIFFTVKRNPQDTDANALISVDITSHSSPTLGITEIPLTSIQTALIGTFYYDVKIKIGTEITSVEMDKIIFLEHATIRTS